MFRKARTAGRTLAASTFGIIAFAVPQITSVTIALTIAMGAVALGILAITAGVLFARRSTPFHRLQRLLHDKRTNTAGRHGIEKSPEDPDPASVDQSPTTL
jgi:hypothetical protein